ncbi:urease accessory protein UreF [Pseudomonas lopnurensis]|uniref:urease accessory protein UreF n=1 Tax=Pseudomonas lopnurensis TaxID=1477517 RepID=UPI0028A91F8F|nr:urease accessory UreF family protein [Pseudomonas lopnurensis]
MNAMSSQLLALQQADSFFPAGAVACSSGLETLLADGQLPLPADTQRRREPPRQRQARSDVLGRWLHDQLCQRWNSFDRAMLVAAWDAVGDNPTLLQLDALTEAMSLARELRDASRRSGISLLGVHADLETAGARDWQQRIADGQACGHLPVVQGLLWRNLGMSRDDCQLAGAHAFCTGLVSAALRLGVLGHVEAQRVLGSLHPLLLHLLAEEPPAAEDAHSFTPLSEVAVMRHEHQALRLFAN